MAVAGSASKALIDVTIFRRKNRRHRPSVQLGKRCLHAKNLPTAVVQARNSSSTGDWSIEGPMSASTIRFASAAITALLISACGQSPQPVSTDVPASAAAKVTAVLPLDSLQYGQWDTGAGEKSEP